MAAILILKEELEKCRRENCVPVLEEFIPLKKEIDHSEENHDIDRDKNNECRDKKNWMSSVQLWNTTTTTTTDDNNNNNNNGSESDHKVLNNGNKLETKVLYNKTIKIEHYLFLYYRTGKVY